ncbi:restriction alleviation protein, Lar family [Sinorhizobium meliloti]|uniref:Lar family restriction alleviation protein n=1 Tax=Rhizobium meliloti TaxID=382 RepID=UPI000FD9D0AF|nr:Lar family restriction alleviation protein [Sinorhizobium meliloti]RVK75454.1 restriction alleviation protein, Lar family [Sinorhizobium meliloti]
MTEIVLKACPFCGGKAERFELEDEANHGGSVISCTVCDASSAVHFGRKENLYDSWNRRTMTEQTRSAADPSSDVALYGPYGYLNGHRALTEDTWTVENDPIENSDEYFSIPLYAKVEPIFPVSFSDPTTPTMKEETK